MNIWFSADHHFCHDNIIKYCNRPFSSVDEMNETMIDSWNALIRPGDAVYHLGDFMFVRKPAGAGKVEAMLRRLNGNKFLIYGNHDGKAVKDAKGWTWQGERKSIRVLVPGSDNKQHIVLDHYAMRTWYKQHHGSWQLYGHSHGSLEDLQDSKQLDIGVDCWDFKPVSLEQVKEAMDAKTFRPVDHHIPRESADVPDTKN